VRGLWFELLVIVGLTLLNGVFSGAEIALLAVRKTRLQELAAEGHRSARIALMLREDPERFLATVQVGITVIGASAGAFGGAVLEEPMAALLRGLGLGPLADKLSFALVVALVSVLSVVVGELVPKSLALRNSEAVALRMSPPLYFLSRAARPVVWFLNAASNLLLRPFNDSTSFTEARLSPEELQQLVEEAAVAGTVNKDTGDIASRAIDLGVLRAFSVMLPRNQIAWLSIDADVATIKSTLSTQPHARYPVMAPSQQAAGYVLAHDLYAQLLDGKLDLPPLLRPIPTFPESAQALNVLRSLQGARCEIGLVVDETGLCSGLISIEALAEELLGEIAGERETVLERIVPLAEGTFEVLGDTPIHELNRELGFDLPIEPTASTLGGLILATRGSFPEQGATVALDGLSAEILETIGHRIHRVKLRVSPRST